MPATIVTTPTIARKSAPEYTGMYRYHRELSRSSSRSRPGTHRKTVRRMRRSYGMERRSHRDGSSEDADSSENGSKRMVLSERWPRAAAGVEYPELVSQDVRDRHTAYLRRSEAAPTCARSLSHGRGGSGGRRTRSDLIGRPMMAKSLRPPVRLRRRGPIGSYEWGARCSSRSRP